MMVVFLACECVHRDQDEDVPCGPETEGTELCPIDPCAEGCEDVSEAVRCCVSSHGYGITEEQGAIVLNGCEGEVCDLSQYLSDAAARCIAQAYGMEPGVSYCYARVVDQASGVVWDVWNIQQETCTAEDYRFATGAEYYLDAHTGELVARASISVYGYGCSSE